MGNDLVFVIVVLMFDEKASFKTCRFEPGEFWTVRPFIFAQSPQHRTDKERGISRENLPRRVDARKMESIFILRDLG